LYNIAADPTETHNVAGDHPGKLQELVTRWGLAAGKYKVLPIDGIGLIADTIRLRWTAQEFRSD